MDTELVLWMFVFIGGYSAVLAWLLLAALRSKGGATGAEPPPPADRAGPADTPRGR